MLSKTVYLLIFLLSFTLPQAQAEEISPLDLIVPQRADVMAKYIYAKHRKWKTSCQFGTQLYYRHLQLWNGFYEDEPPKRCFADYFNGFNRLLDSIEAHGFNPLYAVPLDHGGVICNGAHRLTACLLYHKDISVHRCADVRDYGFDFFRKLGLELKYLDAMALQYCGLKPNTHVIVIFPCVTGYGQEIEGIIQRYARIVYKKEILFTDTGGVNLILTMYDREPWIGNVENNYQGIRGKAQCCFPEKAGAKQPIQAYLVESKGLDQIKACKSEIRGLFHDLQHAIHATDTHEEAIVLAGSLFNDNSVHCLNYRKDLFFPQFERYLEGYRQGLRGKENDWFCVDGGAVLSAYGLRDCQDLDVLHYEDNLPGLFPASVESHNAYLSFHSLPLDDILLDPDNHFFYRGIKFCTLQLIKQMKTRRNEPKDLQDISLINQVEPFERPHTSCVKILAE